MPPAPASRDKEIDQLIDLTTNYSYTFQENRDHFPDKPDDTMDVFDAVQDDSASITKNPDNFMSDSNNVRENASDSMYDYDNIIKNPSHKDR